MACNNYISTLRDNGGKKLSIKGISGKSTSCNGSVKRTRKVGSFGPDGMASKKLVSTVSKCSKGANVKSSCDKFHRRSSINLVGTVDQAIRERKIFTAVAKMPAEIQTKLIENGWIGKITVGDDYFRRRGSAAILSLHSNAERVKAVVKRYESGLVWMDGNSGGVNWMTLHPDVVVNRFPRNANATLKLCGHNMAGKSEFDVHYPRAYLANTGGIHMDSFIADYSLTACVSLLRAFVDHGHRAMCTKNGQAPLSALHFAATKCHQYITGGRLLWATTFPGKGDGWETFFKHYYMIVHDRKKFSVPGTGDDVDAALCYLEESSRIIVNQMTAARPQTTMDGYENIWIVKDTAGHRHRPAMFNKIGDVLDYCTRAGDGGDRIVQKYIETPLLRDNVKSDVHTWIVVSTLDGKLTVWLHRMCAMQPYTHGFSLCRNSDKSGHFNRLKSGRLHGMVRSTALICGLKQLKAKMRRGTKMDKVQQPQKQQQVNDCNVNDRENVYTAVRRSVVSAVTAAVASGTLKLRPNCLELFRGTFMLGEDSKLWMIDIVSDDPCLVTDCIERYQVQAPSATRVARSIVQGVGMMLVGRSRGRATRIGMFDMVHECPMPAGAGSYVPQLFTASKVLASKTHRPRLTTRKSSSIDRADDCYQHYWWNDDNIHTYVEMISAEDVQDKLQQTPSSATDLRTTMDAATVVATGDDDTNLIAGFAENYDLCDPHGSRRCLKLLDKHKTKIESIQRICQTIIRQDRSNKKRKM